MASLVGVAAAQRRSRELSTEVAAEGELCRLVQAVMDQDPVPVQQLACGEAHRIGNIVPALVNEPGRIIIGAAVLQ